MQLKRQRQYTTGTQLYVWGCDSHGQLGLPQTSGTRVHNLPKQIYVPHNIRTISCGEKHLIFITHDGDVYTQGCNADGKLGIDDNSVKWSNVPVKVSLPLPSIKVHCGMSHTLCILENGDVYAWGFGEYGALGIGQFKTKWKPTKVYLEGIRIKHISAGAMHSSFISANGDLYMCGSNDYGELGNNHKEKLSVPALVHTKSRLAEASCGIFYTLLLDEHGKLYAMGNNKYGQLGTGNKNPESSPVLIKSLEAEFIVKVESGYHSGALNDKGDLFLWGSGTFGEYLRPTKIKKPCPFVELSIGGFFGSSIDNKHNVYTWGNNNSGQLGLGHFENCKQLTEVNFLRGKNIDRVFCGVNFVVGMASGYASYNARGLTHQLTSRQRERQKDDRIQRQSLSSQPTYPQPINLHSSIERNRSVHQLQNTVLELQQNERHLLQDRTNLQLKLETLSADYQKLSKKYDMIEIIVNEKEKIISIYEGKIRELSKNNIYEENMMESKLIKQENKKLIETIERNAHLYAQKLRAKDDIIIRLERTEAELVQESGLIKNELKLSENLLKDRLEEERNSAIRQVRNTEKDILLAKYEALLKQKDKDIVELLADKQVLQKELARETTENTLKHNNTWQTSNKVQTLLKIKDEEEIGYIRKINKLESQLKEKDEQLMRSEIRSISPRRPPDTGRLESSLIVRQFNEELYLKDEIIMQLKKDLQHARLNEEKMQKSSSSLMDALRLENQQLREQLIFKEQLTERLGEQLRVKQQSHLRITRELHRSKESEPSDINNKMSTMEKKYATTFRSMDEISLNLSKQLEKQIEYSTKLKAEVDQLNFQLKRTQKELSQLKILQGQKEKSYEAQIQLLANQKHKDEVAFESRTVESVEQHYIIKGIQEELERTRAELAYEKDISRKNQQSLRRFNEDNINLRKAQINIEGALRIIQDESEIHRAEAERNRRFKKEFQTKHIEYRESQDKIEELGAKVQSLNAQLSLKNKALKDVEKQLKDQIEATERKDTDVNFQLKKLRQAKNKLSYECKQYEQAKQYAVQKMQSVIIEWEREKDYFAGVQRNADSMAKLIQKERSEMQTLQNEIMEVKNELTRTRIQKEQLGRSYEMLQTDYRMCQEKCKQLEEKIAIIQKQMQDISIQMDTNKDQNRRLRQQLAEKSVIASELKNINSQLISANSEFARNQIDYVKKIENLQRQIVDIKSQNDDYNPRFEALIQRNKELDERNAELANTLNKAIERQATDYKQKVLSDVAKNAGNIYEHLKQSVMMSTNKKRRQIPQEPESMYMQEHNENKSGLSGSAKSPQQHEQRREDPYKRMVSAKITDHKRRISESAFKLVELLDIQKDSKNPTHTLGDYQRINDKMESIDMQKSNLLTKINSYAERLKIL